RGEAKAVDTDVDGREVELFVHLVSERPLVKAEAGRHVLLVVDGAETESACLDEDGRGTGRAMQTAGDGEADEQAHADTLRKEWWHPRNNMCKSLRQGKGFLWPRPGNRVSCKSICAR